VSPEQSAARDLLRARILAQIEAYAADPAAFIAAAPAAAARHAEALDALLADLARYQQQWVAPYARFCGQRRCSWAAPALPTDAFRFARVASHDASRDLRVFHSSGTTQGERSAHAFADLGLYDAAARASASALLFPGRARTRLLVVAPREQELPDSSLSYMLARFRDWFGSAESDYLWPTDAAQITALHQAVREASARGEPVALLGTSFAFVHLMDALGGQTLTLPAGSRIMQTGGFKGRSRELSPQAMRAALSTSFGLPEAQIVAEYGMTELSSQLYETTLRDALEGRTPGTRRLSWPPWVRVRVVDPERLEPLPEGREGLVRIDDAANLDSVCAIQTADVGVLVEGGLVLLGRAQGAVARGCSIRADELLGGARA
jgi:acyl-CoA synthetase (AMP-forming)/AMP-acid ligase II